ncbi:type VI secretion system baseplate subunit TssK [Providencia stuartii]|nr:MULTISPECIES: type VI secretion system baseplate subunit TssK [Providencia]SST02268.1 type VI secretion protein, family [Acinetobacter baumannii]MCX3071479.1 type VI secretion system baseplate subunit TssK [Providencia stuartii]MDT2016751.1 type VI secretion system baseplate subunit TssK [Providencia stuartii]MDT2082096.1 type VI secretion system baseplate subunit TssK [Providencia stuartii]HEM6868446.1 type VI secretion system baseplate subunit TssK [Providencia stuartii]
MKIYRPLWNEGALLSPQQFQQQAQWEAFTNQGVSGLSSPFNWGVEKVELDELLLSSGRLQVHQLRAWLPDGTLIDTQVSDITPEPRELNSAALSQTDSIVLVLALPLLQQGIINVQKKGGFSERSLRYQEEWVNVPDVFGQDDESMAVARFNIAVRFQHENNDAWQTCPIARLTRDGQGGWTIDRTFIPPMTQFSASRELQERLALLNRQIRSRCQRLMSMRRESNERLADFAVADVSLFWLLNALNSHANVLMNYESYPQRHPEIIWAELTRLAGSLLTFSLEHDLATIPAYVHDDLENTFPPLFDLLSTNTYVTLRLRREINASDIDRDYYIDAQAICEDWLENINVKYIEVSNDKAKLKLILGEKNCSSLYFITLSKDLNGWKIDSVESF